MTDLNDIEEDFCRDALLCLRLFVASRFLRGLKLLHRLLQPRNDAFERDNLGGYIVQLMSGVERILGHEPLQKIDIALKASVCLSRPEVFVQSSTPAISCAHPASTPMTIRLKPNTAILIMLYSLRSL